jgi:uncharacterized protein (TIGR02246 family)
MHRFLIQSRIVAAAGPLSLVFRQSIEYEDDSMNILRSATESLTSAAGADAQSPNTEIEVRKAVQSFYADFNAHGFGQAAEYTTEDWNHIDPSGQWTRGRAAVLKELNEIHATILNGVSDTIEDISVRFATSDVAVATVISSASTYINKNGIKHENERWSRTFIVVSRSGRWLIMQDHNTIVRP